MARQKPKMPRFEVPTKINKACQAGDCGHCHSLHCACECHKRNVK